MKKIRVSLAFSLLFFALNLHAYQNDELKQIEAVLMTILHDNADFVRQHNHAYFEKGRLGLRGPEKPPVDTFFLRLGFATRLKSLTNNSSSAHSVGMG